MPDPELCKITVPRPHELGGRGRWFILHDGAQFVRVHGSTRGQYPDGPYCAVCAVRELERRALQPAGWPQRGDEVAAWLRRRRDMHFRHSESWEAIDGLLDDYRLHADTGTPLAGHVSETSDQRVELIADLLDDLDCPLDKTFSEPMPGCSVEQMEQAQQLRTARRKGA